MKHMRVRRSHPTRTIMIRMNAPPLQTATPFGIELLADLRSGGYRPAMWVRFFARSWARSVEDIAREPRLLRSFGRQTLALIVFAAGVLAWQGRTHPRARHKQHVVAVAVALLLQQLHVLLHLGMTQMANDTPRDTALGIANFLSQVRGMCATLLLVMGEPHTAPYAVTLVIGAATDVLDGWFARRSGTSSRMGKMLDPMADTYFSSAATLVAVRQGGVAPWFGWITLCRFGAPIVAGIYRYFWTIKTVDAQHTAWGKVSGIALFAVLGLSSLRVTVARLPLMLLSAMMLVATALQVRRSIVAERPAK